jgi:Domain of unknown function (DUF4174)
MTLIRIILAVLACAFASASLAAADDPPPFAPISVTTERLTDYAWEFRPLVVFADTPDDPNYAAQINLLLQQLPDLERRKVVVLTDTDPTAQSEIRKSLRPHGFALVLVGLDGRVVFRKPSPWSVREITRAIDKIQD